MSETEPKRNESEESRRWRRAGAGINLSNIVGLVGALGGVLSGLGSYKLTDYRLEEQQKAIETIRLDAKEQREKFETKIQSLEDESRTSTGALDIRTTRLEERLTGMDKKLDVLGTKIDTLLERRSR